MLNAGVKLINFIIDAVVLLLNSIIQFLPDSPFSTLDFSLIDPYLGNLNWLIPVGQIMTFLGFWTTGVTVYYCYTVVLRVTKAID